VTSTDVLVEVNRTTVPTIASSRSWDGVAEGAAVADGEAAGRGPAGCSDGLPHPAKSAMSATAPAHAAIRYFGRLITESGTATSVAACRGCWEFLTRGVPTGHLSLPAANLRSPVWR
jgi:hypothetical protein